MAGMEQIEIHSRNYLLRWVNAKPNHTISWTIQPHKRSINFGLFKHPGALAGLPSVGGLPPLSTTSSRTEENTDEPVPEVVDKLAGIGLKQVVKLGKCEADKFTQGRYDVPTGEAGHYALVFDNTFSKNISKNVTFFLLTFPTSSQSQISFGAQMHHSQAMASAMAMAPPMTGRRSPKLGAKKRQSVDSLTQTAAAQGLAATTPTISTTPMTNEDLVSVHTGILQKRRRKKHQGYARRFFSLDFTSATLSYYHDRNSSALRGAIPLSLAAIGANAKTREISVDSGAEIWHLKASNKADFDSWKGALEKASRMIVENTTPGPSLALDTNVPDGPGSLADEQEWIRLENLLSKISGSRDAVRRLCQETLSTSLGPPSPQLDGAAAYSPSESSDSYFPADPKRAFWKRKPSSTALNSNMFRRSVSAQLAVPSPNALEPVNRSSESTPHRHHHHEENMHDHMKAILQNLNSVVQDFSELVLGAKQRRMGPPKSAASRLSMHSVDSQEYFDAEDRTLSHTNSRLLDIQDDEAEESEDDDKGSVGSGSSSESEDDRGVVSGRGFRSGSLSSLMPPKSKSLSPLPLDAAKRRTTIKAPTIMPPSLIGFLRKNVGKDLSTISMPVSANEPTSLLQRAAENLEYAALLDKAASSSDAQERMLYVTAFAISALSNARVKERSIRKPFNPMLGETYELVREDMKFRFIAEKVSHRPVQLAFYAESADWAFTQSPLPSQKFWGKSSEIITEGKARLVLHGTNPECYSWSPATCFLRNIIAGEKYVEPVGTMTIHNESTGYKAIVSFKAKGMFSGRSEEVDVQLLDPSGTDLPLGLTGTWTSNLVVKESGRADPRREIWHAGPLVDKAEKHYGMTLFAAALNEITDAEKGKLPPTDSRLRADQRALEEGNHEEAERLKNEIEEGQRSRRRDLEAKGEEWSPQFFARVQSGAAGDEVVWKLKTGKEDGYWEKRARGDWSGVVDVLSIN